MVTQLDDVLLGRQVEVTLKLSFKFPDLLVESSRVRPIFGLNGADNLLFATFLDFIGIPF
jgi:hypothetical protein